MLGTWKGFFPFPFREIILFILEIKQNIYLGFGLVRLLLGFKIFYFFNFSLWVSGLILELYLFWS